MGDLLTKATLASLGFLSLSKAKVKEIVKSLVKEGEVAKSDEAKLIKRLLVKAEENKRLFEKKVEGIVEQTLIKLDLPTRKEVRELKEEIKKLSQKLASK